MIYLDGNRFAGQTSASYVVVVLYGLNDAKMITAITSGDQDDLPGPESGHGEHIKNHSVDGFYGLNDADSTLMSGLEDYAERMPHGIIAIGDGGGGGDQVCLALASAERQGVFYWNHEGEVDERQSRTPNYSNMGLTAWT